MKRPLSARDFALLALIAAVAAISALWIVSFRLDRPLDGREAGAMVMFMPAFVLILLALWLLVRAALDGRAGCRRSTVALATLVPSMALVLLNCGPAVLFAPVNNRLRGWCVVAGAVVAALIHHVTLVPATAVPQHGR